MSAASRGEDSARTLPSAASNLTNTRAALRKFVERDTVRNSARNPTVPGTDLPPDAGDERIEPPGAMRVVGAAIEAWWEQNPLAVLPKIAKPLVEEQVRRYPWQAIGLSAAAGAALVLLKPWRRFPAGHLAGALFRTTSVSAITAAALAALQESMISANDPPDSSRR